MTFKDYMISIIGTYVPLEQTVTAADGSSVSQYVAGVAGMDWTWIVSALFFMLVVYSFFRIVGKVIGG